MDNSNTFETSISLYNEFGLHARPAGRIASAAQQFESQVKIILNGKEVDAKSILDILSLAAPQGSDLRIFAQGTDAQHAVEHLKALIRDKLGREE